MGRSHDRDERTAPGARCSPLSRGALVELASLRPGDVVVGLGCGGCAEAVAVGRLVGPSGRVIMIVTDGGGALELPGAPEAPAPRPPLIVRGEVAATGLRSSVADVVVSSCPPSGPSDLPAMYREIARVLKPGGRLVASDVVALHPARCGAYGLARCGDALPELEYLAAVRAAGFELLRLLQRTAPYEAGGRLVLSLTLEAIRG